MGLGVPDVPVGSGTVRPGCLELSGPRKEPAGSWSLDKALALPRQKGQR